MMNEAEVLAPEKATHQGAAHADSARLADTLCRLANDMNNIFAALKGQAGLTQEDPDGREAAELLSLVFASTDKAQQMLRTAIDEIPTELVNAATIRAYRGGASVQAATHMLVVDDEEAMRRVIGRMLERNGYRVTTASSGEEAMRLAAKYTFDIAFVDLRLGDMSGLEVAGELRRRSPSTHIIFVSGDPLLDKLRDEKTSDNLAAFIKKPFDMQEVNEQVSYILTMRAALAL